MTYNYKKAGKLYDEFFDLCCDPWTTDSDEKQQDRRLFMRAVTRGDLVTLQTYVDYVKYSKKWMCEPFQNDKSKCFDFVLMDDFDSMVCKILNFEN